MRKHQQYIRVGLNGRVDRLHRIVMEKHIGRRLKPTEHIHHINGNKLDNRIENLQIVTNSEHHKIHWPGDNKKTLVCKLCNKDFRPARKSGLPISIKQWNRYIYCSRSCMAKNREAQKRLILLGKKFKDKRKIKTKKFL